MNEEMIEKYWYRFCECCWINQSLRWEHHHIVFRSEKPWHEFLHNKLNIFLDIKFKLKFLYSKNFNFKKKKINLDNFMLLKKVNSKYLKLLDVYGEINLINLYLNSSVGRAKDWKSLGR